MCFEVKIIAKDEREAIEIAAKHLKKDESEIKLEKVSKKEDFSIFEEDFLEFVVSLKEDEKDQNLKDKNKIEKTEEKLDEILSFFGIKNFKKEFFLSLDVLHIKISGEDLEFLTRDDGRVLNALQYIIALAVNNGIFEDYLKIILDCDNFREKRNIQLKELSKRLVERVLERKKPVTLKPMNPFERRLIHSNVVKFEGVYSKSVGKDPFRSVVIYPEDYRAN